MCLKDSWAHKFHYSQTSKKDMLHSKLSRKDTSQLHKKDNDLQTNHHK